MEMKTDGGPAFPQANNEQTYTNPGMSLREFAAITLKVPDSGADWLDAMIREALKNEFAGQALAGILANPSTNRVFTVQDIVSGSYVWADAMLAERERGE